MTGGNREALGVLDSLEEQELAPLILQENPCRFVAVLTVRINPPHDRRIDDERPGVAMATTFAGVNLAASGLRVVRNAFCSAPQAIGVNLVVCWRLKA